MPERSFEERARVSAPGLRTFLNISRRWHLTDHQQAHLLACDIATFHSWAVAATHQKHLVLETETLMRLSVVLGVFADLKRHLSVISRTHEERMWLHRHQDLAPFNGRSPFEVLCSNFDEQMTVRRHLAALVAHAENSASEQLERPEQAPYGLLNDLFPMAAIQAVCFDGFGTLVEIIDKRSPYRSLIAHEPSNALLRYAMLHPVGLRDLSQHLTAAIAGERFAAIEADLEAELESIQLRPAMDRAWLAVQRAGLRIAVCSNLAAPYEAPLVRLLPGQPDALALSFQVGLLKPEPEIYHLVCNQLGLAPSEVLFTGDSLPADVVGPSAIGSYSMPITEFERSIEHGPSFYAPYPVARLFELIAASLNA